MVNPSIHCASLSSRPILRAADIRAIETTPWPAVRPAVSMYGLLQHAARLFGERPAFIHLPDGNPGTEAQVMSYAELLRQVTQAANLFHAIGVRETDTVALLVPNTPLGQIALWAAETAARACPINVMLEPAHVAELASAAQATLLVALGPDPVLPIHQRALALRDSCGIDALLLIDGGADSGDGDLAQAMSRHCGDRLNFDRVLDAETPAALFHTGGTSAAPKLAQHLHGNQVHSAWSAALFYALQAQDVVLNGFPLFHVAGSLVYGASCFVAGAAQVLPTRLGLRDGEFARNVWRFVDKHRISFMACVPTSLATLLQTDPGAADISSIRVFYSGGSPLSAELASALERRFERPVRNIFGMTESAGLVSLEPFLAPRVAGSAGLRLPYCEVRALHADPQGQARVDRVCPAGETGILALRGPNVGPGYLDCSRNAGSFVDGWLITGDLGHVDDDGRVYITGRAKDVIIRGAHNIDPQVIEDAIQAHPAVAICAAVGQPDRHAGELPVVFVVLKDGMHASPRQILAEAEPRIPDPAARPKGLRIVPALPMTAIGKIFKPEVRAWAAVDAFEAALADIDGVDRPGGITAHASGGIVRVQLRVRDEQARVAVAAALRDFTLAYEISLRAD